MHLDQSFSASYPVALSMGLLSSVHCMAMCGSIMGALTLSLPEEIRNDKLRILPFVASYNLGRISSYALIGLLVGFAGHMVTFSLGEDGIGHRSVQLFSALFMIGAGLYIAGWFPRFTFIEKGGGLLWQKIEPWGRRFMPVKSIKQAYIFGAIWGWLPCGLIYAALILAASTGDPLRSGITMLMFGIGTLPAVMTTGIMLNYMVKLSRLSWFRPIAGSVIIAIALFTIYPHM
jgi:sulfite exporter TauE/SafE